MRPLATILIICAGIILWVSLLGACIQLGAGRTRRKTRNQTRAIEAAKAQAATDSINRIKAEEATLANAEAALGLNVAFIIPGQDDPVPADKVHDWILTYTRQHQLEHTHHTRCPICRAKAHATFAPKNPDKPSGEKSDKSFPENRPEQFPKNRPDEILEKPADATAGMSWKETHQAFLAKMREQYPHEMRGLTGREADLKAHELQIRELFGGESWKVVLPDETDETAATDFPEVSGRDPTNLGGCSDLGSGVANLDPDLEKQLPRKYPPAKPENPVTRFNKAHSDKRCDRIDNHSRHVWSEWTVGLGLGPDYTCPGVTNPAKHCKRIDAHGLHSWWSFDDNHEFTCPGSEPTPVRSVRPGTCPDKSVHQPHLWRVDNETRSYQCRGVLREVLPPAPKPVESHIDQAWQHYQDAVVDKGVNSPNASTAWGRFMKLRELEPTSTAAEPVPTGGWVRCPHCNTTLRTDG